MTYWSSRLPSLRRLIAWCAVAALTLLALPSRAAADDQIYFSAVDDIAAQFVQRINAETVRIDISAWYLSDSTVYSALLNRWKAGVKVRLIGDRGSIFEIDQPTKNTFYYLASQGLPIRLRYNPTWYPEIDHWKTAIFVGQGVVGFGSPNFTPFELTPFSSTNYHDELTLFTSDPTLVNAFKTKFDTYWNDTASEPESLVPSAPYFKNWDDACASESACSDYRQQYPNPVPMVIDTRRLEPDYPMPPEMVWGQGPSFNNRLTDEINKESSHIDFVIYRLTVDNITNALLAKKAAGVPIRLFAEPNEYLNRKWPEFWITHANVDKLWAAGIPIKWRVHDGLTHMKVLITSTLATIASSNYAAAWQRDQDYFMPASAKPAIYSAIQNRFNAMWNDTAGFTDFKPQGPDQPVPVSPASGSSGVSATPTLTWNNTTFATNYDVYLGTSQSSMSLVGNVPAQMVNNPPSTYSYTVSSPLAGNTTYFWKVVAKTNATPRDPNMVSASPPQAFTTAAGSGGGGGGGGSSVPAPWLTTDVGSVGTAGSANYSNGVFTVAGAGADIWGSADGFRYVYQPVSGDVQIVARVASVQNTDTYAKAGVMLRESLAAGAAHVILDVRPDGSIEFMTRSATNGATTYLGGGTQAPPAWLKLARSGNTVTGSVSSNGTSWTVIGSTSTAMSTSANLGFLVTSHNTSVLNTSTFDNVALGAGSTPPPPPGAPASPSPSNGATGVSTAPTLTWSSSGASTYNVNFGTANPPPQVATGQAAASYTPSTLSAGTTYFWQIVAVNAGGSTTGAVWSFTTATAPPPPPGTPTSPSPNNGATGVSVSPTLTWTASNATGYDVKFGTSNPPPQVTTNQSAASYAPNTLSSNTTYFWQIVARNAGGTTSGPVWTFTTAAAASGLPSPWSNQDIGATGLAGSASYSNGAFNIAGAGGDIWDTTDAFQYVSQPTSGDFQIVARVTGIQNTHQWAKAGVMLRQSLTPTSAHVLLDVTPSGTIEFMTRTANGATTTLITYGTQPVPAWLKLVRSGNNVTASISGDGSSWTSLGTTSVSIPASAFAGMAVTSHTTSSLNTSTFDNVAVTTTVQPPPPPPPTATNVVIYASDIPASARHGAWVTASDATSPNSTKLMTPDNGVANTSNALASPADYVDVTFTANANTPYTFWMRMKATANSKYNDSLWVQFSDAQSGGGSVYPIGSTSGLSVNLATDSAAGSLNNWGWQNTSYWLSQATTVTFPTSGSHTLRIQTREDGVQFDQIVLSPSQYLNSAPGPVSNDSTIVPKP